MTVIFVARNSLLLYNSNGRLVTATTHEVKRYYSSTVMKIGKAVTAHLKSQQLLLFGFALHYNECQRQTAVTAYLKSKQLLLFAFLL